jgi:CHAT domain-containing protein
MALNTLDNVAGIAVIIEMKDEALRLAASQPARARQIAEQAYQLGLALPAPAGAYGRWALANALLFNEAYQQAAQFYAQARDELLAYEQRLDCARMSVGYVGALAYTGQAQEALTMVDAVQTTLEVQAADNASDARRLANLLMNAGVCYELLGQYEESLALADRQIALAQQLHDVYLEATIRHNRAATLVLLNAFSEADEEFFQAERIFQAEAATLDLVRLYINRCQRYVLQDRDNDALAALDRAQQLLQELEDAPLARHMLARVRSAVLLRRSEPLGQTQLEALRLAIQAFAQHGPAYEECLCRLYLGQALARQQAWLESAAELHSALQLAGQGAERLLEHLALHALGANASQQGDSVAAIERYSQAIAVIEALRTPLRLELFRAGFLEDKLYVYHDLASAYAQIDQLAQAFQTVDQAKGRLLTEKLSYQLQASTQRMASAEGVGVIAQQLNETLARLEHLYQQVQLTRQAASANANLARGADVELQQQVRSLEGQADALLRKLQRQRSTFSPLAGRDRVTLEQVKTALKDAVFLQYHLLRHEVWVFVVDCTGIRQHIRLANLEQIETQRQALNLVIARTLDLGQRMGAAALGRFAPTLLNDALRHLQALYQTLIAPIERWLPQQGEVILSPDDCLHALPFHAFFDGQRFLVEQTILSYTPNADVFVLLAQAENLAPVDSASGHNKQRTDVLFGYDNSNLSEVIHEIAHIQAFNQRAMTYVQSEANTSRFLDVAPAARLVHMAAHAQFRSDQPMLSSIQLADRRLTLAEISQLQLQADLVVLSACETARSQQHGADSISLAAGFLGAGARSLVVSLWRTADAATTMLMQGFYQNFYSGQSVAAALRNTQLAMLNQARSSAQPAIALHPAFWAPFIVIGDGQVKRY